AFANDLSELRRHRGRLVIRHVAAAPAVDASVRWFWFRLAKLRDLSNGGEASVDLRESKYRVSLNAAGTRTRVFGPAEVPVSADVGTIVYAIGSLEDESFTVVVQNYDIPAPAVVETGKLSVVHGVPGLTVDVYLNGGLALEGFEPDTITDELELPAGDYEVAIAPAGAGIEAAVITGSATLPAGANATAVAHLNADGNPTLSLFVNDVSRLRAFKGRLVVRHVAAAPTVDVVASRGRWFSATLENISNAMEAQADILIGPYHASIFPAGGDEAVAGPARVLVTPRQATIVYAAGSLEDGTFRLLVQRIRVSRR
ncbi:MAG: DUF4397 domain-containing protein, partial [Planctomycetota bacterium]